ncbi:hypothetical protein ADL22_12605 [Streptomyces sp. NRRL F-4489]|uniref:hypothetical protein n=1 Tax=Streptomyces sp. NRRL F-4489 TaxID=1609095 RepID=UPI000746E3F0|nr:hypothetical protein [Streptomyces sp. NRRL F-4489]KUL44777.1 hypothetical protein ADL22_12605 [Streptomyces sp. NRRL F-4489]
MAAKEKQYFHAPPFRYDIDAAWRLIERSPRETHRIKVSEWARALGLAKTPEEYQADGKIPLVNYNVDEEYAKTVDISKPLIFVDVSGKGEEATYIMIDGGHRLRRAVIEGVEELPGYALDKAEAALIREVKFYR